MPDEKQPPVKKPKESLADLLKRKKELKKGGAGEAELVPVPEAPIAPLSADQQRLIDAMDGKLEAEDNGLSLVKNLPVDLIDPNPTPQRTVYLDSEIRIIAESIQATEQRDAVHVRPNPESPGRYIICDGWTRVLALKTFGAELGLPSTVDARVHADLSALEGSLYGFRQNKERHETTDLDDGFFIHSLLTVHGQSKEQVVKELGLKHAQLLSQYLSFVGLAPEILDRIKPYKVVFTKTYAAPLRHLQEEHGVEAANKALDEILTEKEGAPAIKSGASRFLEKFRKRLDTIAALGKDYGKTESTAGSVPLRHGKLCKLEDRGNSLEVKFKHKDLSPTQKVALRDDIQALFKKYFPLEEA